MWTELESFILHNFGLLWILPALFGWNRSFPLKHYFTIIAVREIVAFLFTSNGFYYQNTIYHISGLMMVAVIINPRSRLAYFDHSLITFYLFAGLTLTAHFIAFYIYKFYIIEIYIFLIVEFLLVLFMMLACTHRLKYELSLNYYVVFLLGFFLFSFIRLAIFLLELYSVSVYFALIDIIPIIYFSIADYSKSKPIFNFD
jgi:hypothetical protein